jgi:hypothetical protein
MFTYCLGETRLQRVNEMQVKLISDCVLLCVVLLALHQQQVSIKTSEVCGIGKNAFEYSADLYGACASWDCTSTTLRLLLLLLLPKHARLVHP